MPMIEVDPAWVQQPGDDPVWAPFACRRPRNRARRSEKGSDQSPYATFLMRVRSDSMREAGIDDGDVVDRAIKAADGHVVVAVVDGEFTVKSLWQRGAGS